MRARRATRTPIPVSAPDSFGPGQAIAAGFTVPPGTLLVGGSVATGSHATGPSGPVADHGWTALLEVTGDPLPVMAALIAQAHRAGITLAPSEYPAPDGQSVDTGAYCSMGDTFYGCAAAGAATGRSFAIVIRRQAGHGSVPPSSFARLTYEAGAGPVTTPTTLGPPGSPPGPAPPPVPAGWSSLTAVGHRFGDGYSPDIEPLVLLGGSRLLAPITPDDCANAGWSAVLAVDGNPPGCCRLTTANRSGSPSTDRPPPSPTRTAPAVSTALYSEEPGGVSYEFPWPNRPRPSLLAISTCVD